MGMVIDRENYVLANVPIGMALMVEMTPFIPARLQVMKKMAQH